jgi:hypothetical protein
MDILERLNKIQKIQSHTLDSVDKMWRSNKLPPILPQSDYCQLRNCFNLTPIETNYLNSYFRYDDYSL